MSRNKLLFLSSKVVTFTGLELHRLGSIVFLLVFRHIVLTLWLFRCSRALLSKLFADVGILFPLSVYRYLLLGSSYVIIYSTCVGGCLIDSDTTKRFPYPAWSFYLLWWVVGGLCPPHLFDLSLSLFIASLRTICVTMVSRKAMRIFVLLLFSRGQMSGCHSSRGFWIASNWCRRHLSLSRNKFFQTTHYSWNNLKIGPWERDLIIDKSGYISIFTPSKYSWERSDTIYREVDFQQNRQAVIQ